MKQNPNYLLRNVAGSTVLVPVGEATKDFPGMITMNPTSTYLWEQLTEQKTEADLVQALLDRYEVTEAQAQKDVSEFVKTLTLIGAIQ
jgi:hypothetical protein